ncbi:NAD(P)-dependent alcohol dehydrogenase [Baekduia soli]|uniref:alcohol dehydrogenase (NADP(+)) n=1 Tax=Baekduia soli TaxID=496014 RepID=A0A5B8U4D3_9ACTN|nr:NAD(P)-dependent alcohol dehydrogenase [Baekduia soli]QEC47944.1 NAD(P)-dependent alcohol dehydrogenase [Baekduia soli]
MLPARGYAATAPDAPLAPHAFERRDLGPRDVQIAIAFCGVCHSDLHMARSEWGTTPYPLVPGHEIVGHVTAVGAEVSGFAPGDPAGVGCMVDSCRTCEECGAGLEQFCEQGNIQTYGSIEPQTGKTTAGGYSNTIVVDEAFVLRIAPDADLAATAPLLCAGITTYSPLRHWDVGPGSKVGIVGLGGLGHMGVKLAAAMGAEVVLFTTSEDKIADGKALGAHEVVVSKDRAQMKPHTGSLDLIINTVAASHDLDTYLRLLRRDGSMVLVGVPEHPHPSPSVFMLLSRRRKLSGSLIGGIAETQEMLDFCAERGITSDIEIIPISAINDAYERMLAGDVRFRFVIDMATLEG